MDIKRLRDLRKRLAITQLETAKMLGFSHQSYNNYENGKREPDHQTLIILADFFNVTTDYLLGYDSSNPTPTPPTPTLDDFLEEYGLNKKSIQTAKEWIELLKIKQLHERNQN